MTRREVPPPVRGVLWVVALGLTVCLLALGVAALATVVFR